MKYLIALLLLVPFFGVAQYILQGKVVNSKTQKGIPYATIGLVKKNTGTNAGKDGSFKLTTASGMQNDTLLVSCTGYRPKQLPIATFTNEIIELTEDTTVLATVVVTGNSQKKWQTVKLNDYSNSNGMGLSSDGSQTEVALHLQLPGIDGYLKEVKIRQGGRGIFSADKTIFRLKVYRFDTLTKGPASEIYSQLTEVESNGMNTTKINLEEQLIYLPQKDFFVAVEWLKIPFNEIKGTSVAKDGSDYELLWYRPNIGGTDATTDQPEIWAKSYRGIWRKQWDTETRALAISATIKY